MLIYTLISTHGYGHAARQSSVLRKIKEIKPEWRIVISTEVNKRILDVFMQGVEFEYRKFKWDIGVNQLNALTVNLKSTLTSISELNHLLPDQIKSESEWIKSQKEDVIFIADIPPSAFRLSKSVGAPLYWIGNFGWDDIYAHLGNQFKDHSDRALEEYSQGKLLIRCPFSLPMKWGIPEQSIGLTVDRPRHLRNEIKSIIKEDKRTKVIVAFGGMGYDIDPKLFSYWPDHLFLISEDNARGNFEITNNILLMPKSIRVLDVLPFCTRHIGKPGYSSFCEAISQRVGLHVVERETFAEASVLMEGLKKFAFHRIITEQSLSLGDWKLDIPLIDPTNKNINLDGALEAARLIIGEYY